jgi:hypothetical protein
MVSTPASPQLLVRIVVPGGDPAAVVFAWPTNSG